MADSSLTKKALAEAMKALMEEMPFDKINVAHICQRCGINRQSFYYHFRDKYDLVNWIFDVEFIEFVGPDLPEYDVQSHIEFMERACQYFYDNRSFYCKALMIKGQNSFADHLREYIRPILREQMEALVKNEHPDDFSLEFFVDACYGAIERWLLDPDCIPPKRFVEKLFNLIKISSAAIYEKLQGEV